MNRDLYAVVVTAANGIAPRAVRYDTHAPVSGLATMLIVVNNTPVTPEDVEAAPEPIPDDLSRYEIWSWDGRRIPLAARVGQIPPPGVCFVIEAALVDEDGGGALGLLPIVKRELQRDEGPAKFRRHLAGPAAHWRGQPLSAFDVLVSAAPGDGELAAGLGDRFAASGLTTRRSVRPPTLDLGGDELRRELAGCLVVVSILSPTSVGDPRVAVEAGAAWALGKPFVPLLVGLARHQLPPAMAARQCVEANDAAALARLPGQVGLLVRGR